MVGSPSSVAYARFQMSTDSTKIMPFTDRMRNYLIETIEAVAITSMEYLVTEPFYSESFPLPQYPVFAEAKKNVSLVFCKRSSQ